MTPNPPTSEARFQEALDTVELLLKPHGSSDDISDDQLRAILESLTRTIAAEKARDGVDIEKLKRGHKRPDGNNWSFVEREENKIWNECIDHLAALGMIGQKDDPLRSLAMQGAPGLIPQPHLENVLIGCANILDVVKQEWGPAWTEWDQSIRDGITQYLTSTPLPAAPAPSKEEKK